VAKATKQSKGKGAADRFYVQADRHHLFQHLSQGSDAPFTAMKDVFVLAAALGYRAGIRRPLTGGTQHVGFWHYLSSQEDIPLLQAIALADSGDVEVLGDQGAVIKIAEEYANEGIQLLLEMERANREGTLRSIAAAVAQVDESSSGSRKRGG
jgi:dnd system-associated protein 4